MDVRLFTVKYATGCFTEFFCFQLVSVGSQYSYGNVDKGEFLCVVSKEIPNNYNGINTEQTTKAKVSLNLFKVSNYTQRFFILESDFVHTDLKTTTRFDVTREKKLGSHSSYLVSKVVACVTERIKTSFLRRT